MLSPAQQSGDSTLQYTIRYNWKSPVQSMLSPGQQSGDSTVHWVQYNIRYSWKSPVRSTLSPDQQSGNSTVQYNIRYRWTSPVQSMLSPDQQSGNSTVQYSIYYYRWQYSTVYHSLQLDITCTLYTVQYSQLRDRITNTNVAKKYARCEKYPNTAHSAQLK